MAEKLGIAYVVRVGDHHSFFNTIGQMREQVQVWRTERPNVSISFVTSVFFNCLAPVEECEKVFSPWNRHPVSSQSGSNEINTLESEQAPLQKDATPTTPRIWGRPRGL